MENKFSKDRFFVQAVCLWLIGQGFHQYVFFNYVFYTAIKHEHKHSLSQRSSEKPYLQHGYRLPGSESGGGMQTHLTLQDPGSGAPALLPAEPQVTYRYEAACGIVIFLFL